MSVDLVHLGSRTQQYTLYTMCLPEQNMCPQNKVYK